MPLRPNDTSPPLSPVHPNNIRFYVHSAWLESKVALIGAAATSEQSMPHAKHQRGARGPELAT